MKSVVVAAFRAAFNVGAILALTPEQFADRRSRLAVLARKSPLPGTDLYEVLASVEFRRTETIGVPADTLDTPLMREILVPAGSEAAVKAKDADKARLAGANAGAARRHEKAAAERSQAAAAAKTAHKGPVPVAPLVAADERDDEKAREERERGGKRAPGEQSAALQDALGAAAAAAIKS